MFVRPFKSGISFPPLRGSRTYILPLPVTIGSVFGGGVEGFVDVNKGKRLRHRPRTRPKG